MANRPIRYRELERYITYALIAGAILFVLYLICAGNGIVWLKVVLSVILFLLSGGCLAVLYLRKELLRHRSLWMTAGALAILICLLFSLVLNYPSPNPYKSSAGQSTVSVIQAEQSF